MLDNLVESKSNLQNTKRRGSYLITTGFLVFSLFASGILWSLFAKDLDIGNDSLELSSIVPPVPMAEEPPTPEPIRPKQDNSPKVENALPNRNENIARLDETQPIPEKISTSPNTKMARPKGEFNINPDAPESNGTTTGRNTNEDINGSGSKIVGDSKDNGKSEIDEVPPPTIKKAEPKVEKPKTTVSKGVINGTAITLPRPNYPAAAKAVGAKGDVNVQVTIDEKGNVISANAVSGHALLRQVSENAARSAKFKPTFLSEVPVKVTGVIVYKFSTQ
jgi:periplasmic protein TonB